MILKLERRWKKDTYTIGVMFVDGVRFSETIEDKDRGLRQDMPLAVIKAKKVNGKTAIPTGTYRLDMNTISPQFRNRSWAKPFGGIVPRFVNVPGYTGVIIHPFNTAEDSYGCVAVGQNNVKGKVMNSTVTFLRLMNDYLWPAKQRGEDIYITII